MAMICILGMFLVGTVFVVFAHTRALGASAESAGDPPPGEETLQEIHPIAKDFVTDSTGTWVGRVMISTDTADAGPNKYWTNAVTTADNSAAQTKDGKVTISAYMLDKTGTNAVGVKVYFRVQTPAPTDVAPYATSTTGTSNRDTTVGAGQLSSSTAMTATKIIGGVPLAVAEVELTITDRYCGDNYRPGLSR